MNNFLKLIIIGFALMIFGGIMLILSAFSNNLSSTFVLISYGYFLGFILIIIGVIKHPNDK